MQELQVISAKPVVAPHQAGDPFPLSWRCRQNVPGRDWWSWWSFSGTRVRQGCWFCWPSSWNLMKIKVIPNIQVDKMKLQTIFSWFTFLIKLSSGKKNDIDSNISCLDKEKIKKDDMSFWKMSCRNILKPTIFPTQKNLRTPQPPKKSLMLVFEAFFGCQGGTIFRTTLEWWGCKRPTPETKFGKNTVKPKIFVAQPWLVFWFAFFWLHLRQRPHFEVTLVFGNKKENTFVC